MNETAKTTENVKPAEAAAPAAPPAPPAQMTLADFNQELNALCGKYNVVLDAEAIVSMSNTGLLSCHARLRVTPRQ